MACGQPRAMRPFELGKGLVRGSFLSYINNMTYYDTLHDYAAGDIISIPFGGVLRHYGVVTSRGTVISNSRRGGGVVEQSVAEFRRGRPLSHHGGSGGLHPFQIEARARRALGSSYDLAGSNCIDFTRHTHRRTPTPWQVGRATLMALGDMMGKVRR